MKQIEIFVNSVYKISRGNNKEIQELKTEIKSHLLEAVHELMAEGKSQQEAIDIAIERFGGEKEIQAIGQMFKSQKIFAKRVLYIAFTALIVCLVASGLIWTIEKGNRNENSVVPSSIYDLLGNKAVISIETEEMIKALVRNSDQITKVQVFKTSDVKTVTEDGSESYFNHNAKPMYQYVKEIRPS
jgi:uncharacterized protein YoaH (UPF0181 family)